MKSFSNLVRICKLNMKCSYLFKTLMPLALNSRSSCQSNVGKQGECLGVGLQSQEMTDNVSVIKYDKQ